MFLASCGQSASEDADAFRKELETQEHEVEQHRLNRDRKTKEALNRINNERYERINSEN